MDTFTIIDPSVAISTISDNANRVYDYLASKCYGNKDNCFPAQATIALATHRSVRTVQRGLYELVRAGIIKITRRGSTSNLYTLLNKIKLQANKIYNSTVKKVEETIRKVKNSSYSNKKTSTFNNFKQRDYDFDDLERKLLGWDKENYDSEKLTE